MTSKGFLVVPVSSFRPFSSPSSQWPAKRAPLPFLSFLHWFFVFLLCLFLLSPLLLLLSLLFVCCCCLFYGLCLVSVSRLCFYYLCCWCCCWCCWCCCSFALVRSLIVSVRFGQDVVFGTQHILCALCSSCWVCGVGLVESKAKHKQASKQADSCWFHAFKQSHSS